MDGAREVFEEVLELGFVMECWCTDTATEESEGREDVGACTGGDID